MYEIEFLDYIRCLDPSTFPHPAWRKWDTILRHIDEITQVYKLMVEEGLGLTEASKRANPRNYRRLEATVKALKLVEQVGRRRKKYVPAGVLCECRLYLSYTDTKPSWRRKAEVMVTQPAPIGYPCSELVNTFDVAVSALAEEGFSEVPWDLEAFEGCDKVDCGRVWGNDCWCNYKLRVPLFDVYGRVPVIYRAEMYKYKGAWYSYATYEGTTVETPHRVRD